MGKEERYCLRCGKAFQWERMTARYCSDACSKASYAERKRAERDAKVVKVEVTCANPACGKALLLNPSSVKAHNFCGVECRGVWRKSTQDTRTCANCGASFGVPHSKPMQKFCGKACSHAFQAKERQREVSRRQAIMSGSYREMGRGKGGPFEHDIFSGPEIWVEWVGPDERTSETPEGAGLQEEVTAAVRELQAVGMVQGF